MSTSEHASRTDLKTVADILEDANLAQRLRSIKVDQDIVRVLAQLAKQAVHMGIDYQTLGVGWHHPDSRAAYRSCKHRSTCSPASRKRAAASRARLRTAVASAKDRQDMRATLTEEFLREIGVANESRLRAAATWPGVVAALQAELLLPLRALNEGRMTQTMCGASLPEDDLKGVVLALTEAVLKSSTGFSEWRYSSPRGQEQLRGLSDHQICLWQEPTAQEHRGGLKTHEDAPGELGFFWATKIGGPSHGFDYESQCILPLLANARHKVILVSVAAWTEHPVGRAHWRLLWSVGCGKKPPEPRLWLETVNADFEAPVSSEGWETAVLSHDVEEVSERMLLRASNAIVEASDYLSSEHDWVQDEDEITMPISRALYTPRRKRPLEEAKDD